MATDAQLTRKFLASVRRRFPGCFAWKISTPLRAGIPDSVLVINGRTTWVEFKRCAPQHITRHVTEIQKVTIAAITKAGGRVLVVCFEDGQSLVFDHTYTQVSTSALEYLDVAAS